ncbi:chromate transporter [Herbaspirillum rubrisubalbicans]|uniref:Chromate transporter n=1 Tax=Herbaspirillum rubrisubalbicans TaxID=80842 RepID=A0AAD0XGS5_9BURK|nr:chromate transporter [Herbaspirillum rubrisubalbicans]AYR25656.1 chromate transporter [Herbaspirillum rubrisubalbicans]
MMMSTPDLLAPERPIPTTREIFLGFLGLGMTAFGGALPLAQCMIVERRRWLTDAEFVELLGLCQFLPGGNIINLSVALGMKFRGWKGALAGITGLIAVPSVVVILLGMIYQHFQHDPNVKHLFAGLAAAAAGLLIQMAVKITLPLRKNVVLAAVAVACFIAIALLRIPLLWVMLVMTPISIFLTARYGERFAAKPQVAAKPDAVKQEGAQ